MIEYAISTLTNGILAVIAAIRYWVYHHIIQAQLEKNSIEKEQE